LLADIAKNDREWEVNKAAIEKLSNPKTLKEFAEMYLSDISADECNYIVWGKVEILISIAKKFPEILKKNWKPIDSRIKKLHEDSKHADNRASSDCHIDVRAINETASSKGLHFPPYPFND
jgi:hypothetical protein